MILFGHTGNKLHLSATQITLLLELVRQPLKLFLVGVPPSCKEEEHSLGEGLNSARSFLSFFTKLGDGVASEGDASHGVQMGAIVEHDRESPHAKDGVVDLDLCNNLVAM